MTYFTIGWIALTFIIPFALRKRGIQESQMVATTLGILGTFIGIVYGLLHFDTGNIDDAVPLLLDGLKFAFVTSIAGMGVSLVFGLFPKTFGFTSSEEEANKNKSESELLAEVLAEIKTLNASIAGDNDTTLITQIQKMRTSITDKQDELKKSFDQFAEGMVNSNIDALAEAIDKVMGEFNTTVNEKLGKTFDDFRNAVDNLNQWQSDYKGQIDSQTENMKTVQTSLGTVTDSLDKVAKSLEEITVIKEKFDAMLEQLNAQLQGSIDFSTAMKGLSSEIEGSGKMIRDELNDITRGAADEMEKTVNKTLADFGSSLASISGRMATDFERIQVMLENSNNR
jgi:DNA repair ATPase RecN